MSAGDEASAGTPGDRAIASPMGTVRAALLCSTRASPERPLVPGTLGCRPACGKGRDEPVAQLRNPSGARRQERSGGVDPDGHRVVDEAAELPVLPATETQECPVPGAGADQPCRVEGRVGER